MSRRSRRPADPAAALAVRQFLDAVLALPEGEREDAAFLLMRMTDLAAAKPLAAFGKVLSVAALVETTFVRALYRTHLGISDDRRAALRHRSRKPDPEFIRRAGPLLAAGLKHAAIARRLGMSVDTFRSRLRRARKAGDLP
jgi:hypothetical protein